MLLLCSQLLDLRQPSPLPDAALSDLAHRGYCVVPQWLSPSAVATLHEDMQLCAPLSRSAGVGSTRHGDTAIRQDTEIRRSRMLPLYPPPSPSAGNVDTRLALAEAVRFLHSQLESANIGLPQLERFRTELAYLYYPVGGHYQLHIDVPSARGGWSALGRSDEDGGSFSGAALRREVSMLLYLDAGWDPAWGGALRIHLDENGHAAGAAAASAAAGGGGGGGGGGGQHVDVVPEGGTLVLFRSDQILHEVLETRRPRHAIVGWFRQYTERRRR